MAKEHIEKYLDKHADLGRWPLRAGSTEGVDQVVVIPVLVESEYLFKTLSSLAENSPGALLRTLIICVVNNRKFPAATYEQIEDNQQTLEKLVKIDELADLRGLRLGYVDASSSGNELPDRDGVGLARKIGLDHALKILSSCNEAPALLFCLDADTLVEPNYLEACPDFFMRNNVGAAVVDYAHPLSNPGICCYEMFLRYHELGLRFAGSAYAFPTIGSTMVCTCGAYATVSGMNRRQAGEDFYFLQKLRKTCGVGRITLTTVHPSPRDEPRTPFGTAERVKRFSKGGKDIFQVYHPEVYSVIKRWNELVERNLESDAESVLSQAQTICDELKTFLVKNDFAHVWTRIKKNNPDSTRFLHQFHCWFDAFKTLKLIHFLRDHGYPNQDIFSSVIVLLKLNEADVSGISEGKGLRGDIGEQRRLVELLRKT